MQSAQCTGQSTEHRAQCTMHNAQCTMNNAQCTMHNAQGTENNAQGRTQITEEYNAQCTAQSTEQRACTEGETMTERASGSSALRHWLYWSPRLQSISCAALYSLYSSALLILFAYLPACLSVSFCWVLHEKKAALARWTPPLRRRCWFVELRLVLPEAPSDCGEVYTINSKGTTTPPAVIVKEQVRRLL